MARHTSGSHSGAFVTLLTAAAIAVVAFFAYQASAADDRPGNGGAPSQSASPSGEGGGEQADPSEGPPPVPAESGTGKRVVYSVEQRRVWLVDLSEDGTGEVVADTYEVFPSSVTPPPGEYAVEWRTAQGSGSDGVPTEHTVGFHQDADGIAFGFSAALDGSTPDPESSQRTGALRQTREDGDTMWLFATAGIPVIVVP
ncbi:MULTISPECIES: hypothetical protein [unclassified Streptomyces]|uniref:Secreted protein n=1 Tax=Streptomyces johnsoniae TaxID=3075532 RepID=A0ABU2S3Q5_9ACTN|nr:MULTISPECIES: hypothetical protein [unclassified Streptomyces]MDT0443612.1 hypothetical protein [Streptomyces sp. DSM 41886]ONK12020.1 hypothetical protein STBA_27560 [Streptomyces sp. MP131-18]